MVMPITFDKSIGCFHIQSKNSSYVIGTYYNKLLSHIYYGKRLENLHGICDTTYFWSGIYCKDRDITENEMFSSQGAILEYSTAGVTDKRKCAFGAVFEDGSMYFRPFYKSYKIYSGKPKLSGLPATYVEEEGEATTLEILLSDDERDLDLVLRYTVYENTDAITRNVDVINRSQKSVDIKSAMSMSIDFTDNDFDFVHLYGAWARERRIQKGSLLNAGCYIESTIGASGHYHSPFVALARKNADEKSGEVYGFSLVYSGNFYAGADVDPFNITRLTMGISPSNFSWKLEGGQTFVTPEVVMVYSAEGYGAMSRTYHKLYRTRLVRGKFRDAHRPVLINNWEGTYFDFNEQKIVDIASEAQKLGIELMVLDDGWFGKRNNDRCSLGDWYANIEKLPEGIPGLAKKVNDVGMKFGLWYEPEMVSPDSELYRAHPDWCIHVPGKPQSLGRHQLTLDLTRKDVCDYIKAFMTDMLSKADISYVKWDMNKNFAEIGSAQLPKEKWGEFEHRYMLNLYDILEDITTKFPDVLFEGCASGGGRYDAGMLYYYPQYWCSDDSDAIERLSIQYGTSMVMPASTMGAHVSAIPNHQCGRSEPLETRAYVAMCGTFGYELNMLEMSDEDKEQTKKHVELFKQVRDTIHNGDMYRLKSPFDSEKSAFQYVNDDKSESVLVYVTILGHPNNPPYRLKLEGLDNDAVYLETTTNKEYSGQVLMNVGMLIRDGFDYSSKMFVFKKQ